MIVSVEFSAFPMAKKIVERTPMVEAARVRGSCSFTELHGTDLILHSHSGSAGMLVLEPRLWRGDSADVRGSQLVSGEV